ncbi:hypothetical protein N0V86_002842 [Didymella sp. IMI 355093]|nr:hypothetical protein N0V86_002842 [Didymella sp. IMI 355093]
MSKRSALLSPVGEQHEATKAKLKAVETEIVAQSGPKYEQAVDNITDAVDPGARTSDQTVSEETAIEVAMPQTESPALKPVKPRAKSKVKITKPKRSTKEAFDKSWVPEEAKNDFEPPDQAEPHWGIIPRSMNYRPTEPQPSAKESDAKVMPPLWEDRKGDVRLQGPTRYIEDYDQAHHMYLRLMDQRCDSGSVKPRRRPIHYWYKAGGMLLEWDNPDALNDLNKGLKGAIRTNSHEPAWQPNERAALAGICIANRDASIWDIAIIFNDEIHSLAEGKTEEAGYPSGRTIESVRHEYLCYKSLYESGNAPTKATVKDIRLAQLVKARVAGEKEAKEAEKKAEKEAKKKAGKSAKAAEPKATREKKSRKRKNDEDKKSTGRMRETAGVKKPPRFTKHPKRGLNKEQLDFADANAEENAKATTSQLLEPAVAAVEESHLPEDDEQMTELAGAGEIRSSSLLSTPVRVTITSPSFSVPSSTVRVMEQAHVVQSPDHGAQVTSSTISSLASQPSSDINVETQYDTVATVVATQNITTTEVLVRALEFETAPIIENPSQAAVGQVMVKESFIDKAARDINVDDDYGDDDLF